MEFLSLMWFVNVIICYGFLCRGLAQSHSEDMWLSSHSVLLMRISKDVFAAMQGITSISFKTSSFYFDPSFCCGKRHSDRELGFLSTLPTAHLSSPLWIISFQAWKGIAYSRHLELWGQSIAVFPAHSSHQELWHLTAHLCLRKCLLHIQRAMHRVYIGQFPLWNNQLCLKQHKHEIW